MARAPLPLAATLALLSGLLIACGSDPGAPDGSAAAAGHGDDDASDSNDASDSGGAGRLGDASATSDSGGAGGDAGPGDASDGADAIDAGDGGLEGADGGSTCEKDTSGAPFTGSDDTWTWIPIPGAKCRGGGDTGIGVNFHGGSDQLLIFFEGGGTCWDETSCSANLSWFDAGMFTAWTWAMAPSYGILDRTKPANPAKDFNYVYIPYCTGDFHAGDNLDVEIAGVGEQQFVGYRNVALDLKAIVASFPDVSRVLVTGESAGGYGATFNYDQVQRAFGCTPVDLLDDSGPTMAPPTLSSCLQSKWRTTWGFDRTILVECGADCPSQDDFELDWLKHVAKTHATRFQGFLSSEGDSTMRSAFDPGTNGCKGDQKLSVADFRAALVEMKQQLAPYPHLSMFVFPGEDHTTISTPYFFTRKAGDATVTDWTASLLAGTATNAGL